MKRIEIITRGIIFMHNENQKHSLPPRLELRGITELFL